MTGIEILSEKAITESNLYITIPVACLCIVGLIVTLVITIIGIKKDNDKTRDAIFDYGYLCIPIFMLTLFFSTVVFPTDTGRKSYTAKVDSDVTMGYMQEHFTNIEYQGDGIWTFEDLEG